MQEVKDGADLGVHGGEFDGAPGHPADIDLVIKVECARAGWADQAALQTGFGKNEHLG